MESLSRSKGAKQSALSACMAVVSGALIPEKMSRKRRGIGRCLDFGCATCSSELSEDELDESDLPRFEPCIPCCVVEGGGDGACDWSPLA